MVKKTDEDFGDARGNLAFSQRLIDELIQQKMTNESVQGVMQGEQDMGQQMEQPMTEEPQQEQPVESTQPKEDAVGEARSMQDIAKTVTEATEMLKQGIEGLTAAVKEITPAKGKLREKLKGKLYGDGE